MLEGNVFVLQIEILEVNLGAKRMQIRTRGFSFSVKGNKTFDFTKLKKDSSPLYILTAKALKGNTFAYYNLTGMLDNVRIYNRALSEYEVGILFLEKKGK